MLLVNVQPPGSVMVCELGQFMCMNTYKHQTYSFGFCCHRGYCRRSSRVSCAEHQVLGRIEGKTIILVDYLLQLQISMYVLVVRVCVCMLTCFSRVQLCDPVAIALQAPLSMEFSRQEYWNELPCLPPGDLPNPGNEPTSPALALGFFTTEPLGTSRC